MSSPVGFCWRHIGVYGGDHSCARLEHEIHCRNCEVFRQAARGLLDRPMQPWPLAGIEDREQRAQPARRMFCLRLGPDWLALDCTQVVEVAEASAPRRIAHRCAGQIEGLVAVRGELHLCVALIELLQLGNRQQLAGERARLILVAPSGRPPIAFRASEVLGLRLIETASIEEAPATMPAALARCVAGIVPFEHGRLALIDEQPLIGILEQALYT